MLVGAITLSQMQGDYWMLVGAITLSQMQGDYWMLVGAITLSQMQGGYWMLVGAITLTQEIAPSDGVNCWLSGSLPNAAHFIDLKQSNLLP